MRALLGRNFLPERRNFSRPVSWFSRSGRNFFPLRSDVSCHGRNPSVARSMFSPPVRNFLHRRSRFSPRGSCFLPPGSSPRRPPSKSRPLRCWSGRATSHARTTQSGPAKPDLIPPRANPPRITVSRRGLGSPFHRKVDRDVVTSNDALRHQRRCAIRTAARAVNSLNSDVGHLPHSQISAIRRRPHAIGNRMSLFSNSPMIFRR